MSELNKSYISCNDDSKVITIQDTGFLIQLPGFFRGKPHFVAYDEIKHLTVAEKNGDIVANIFLKNNRQLEMDGLNEYEGENLKSAFQCGIHGPLSTSEAFANETKQQDRKSTKDKLVAVVVFVGIILIFALLMKIFE